MIHTWSPPASRLRRACALLLAAALTGPVACASEPAVETPLARYLPYGSNGVDTDLIFPREEGASRFLIRNWPPQQSLTEDAMWVFGDWADIGFYNVSDEPPTLVAEAMPFAHPDAPPQTLRLVLNGTEITTVEMPPGWRTYEFEMPAEHLLVGWNELELDFAHNLRPADFIPDSEDRRTLAARFRRLEMRSGLGRPYWPERVEEVTLVTAPDAPRAQPASNDGEALESEPVPTAIEMPADSFIQVYLAPTEGTQVVGELQATFPDSDATGSIRVVAEAVEPDATTPLWETSVSPSAATQAAMTADLSRWAGRPIGVRIRVFGDVNGVVRWNRLGVTGSTPESSIAPATFARVPASGALGRPDVFLIILDAARADRFLGELGAELAPHIQALAADGTQFTHTWAPSSWTGQSIPALWSGMTPDTAGIEHWGSRLPPEITTFPELVFEAGYHTLLFSQHNIYRARPMLRNGFEVFREVESSDITQRVIVPPIAEVVDDQRPTLGVFHLLPPHDPYVPPEPFLGSRSSWYQGERIDAVLLNQFDRRFPSEQVELRDEIRRAALAKYEENVQFADSLVGQLVEDLRREGRYDDALVIVAADHGEAFYEHERFLHTSALYEEFVRIPLVIKWPRSFTGFVPQVDAPVSLIDVTATIIDGLGIDDERANYQGRSLLGLARGESAPPRMLYAYTSGQTDPERDPKPSYAVLWDDLKLIYDEGRETAALYRLSDDPGENRDIWLQESFYSSWLLQSLRLAQAHNSGYLLQIGGAQAEDLDEETVRRLRALGYLR